MPMQGKEYDMTVDSRTIFIRGKEIFLKALTREDVMSSNWFGWFNDEVTCETLQKHYFPNTLESQLDYWEKLLQQAKDGTCIQLGVCKNNDEKLIGIVSLNHIDYVNRKAEISAVMGEDEGKDIKTIAEAWRLIFWHGFNVLNLHRIYGGSISKSVVDLMCRVAACVPEGVRKEDAFKKGKYLDVYEYGVLKSSFNEKYFDLMRDV